MKKFKWPSGQPKSDAEFELLMRALDERLSAEGLLPWQRPLHLHRKLFQALKWSGDIFPPKELANEAGFEGDVLMAKAHRWYEQVYGEALKAELAFGYAPARLGQSVWRVRAGVGQGRVEFFADVNLENVGRVLPGHRGISGIVGGASVNVLTQVEGLTPGLAARLSMPELQRFLEFYVFFYSALAWRERLPSTELFRMARGDYDESTAGVLGNRYGQARWAAQQAVEKTIKGFLALGGTQFPKGQDGHNLNALGQSLAANQCITISAAVLKDAACPPAVRYGGASTLDEALRANHAVLKLLQELSASPQVAALMPVAKAPGS